jgi:amino acid permease
MDRICLSPLTLQLTVISLAQLFLNIRHELGDRKAAPRSLAMSLTAFGTFYVIIVFAAGPRPPAFLFDAIPAGLNRRIAGLLLWAHVVVSYAINSQAICSSMDRLIGYRRGTSTNSATLTSSQRWLILTCLMAAAAYTVANAIPFFQDLVALIGALTSVPLTLLLPAVFWRKFMAVPIWKPTLDSLCSYSLLVFAVVFMVAATVGSVYSIQQDWSTHGPPFSCH